MKTSALLVFATLCAIPAIAHEGLHGPASAFDKDGDGSLSLSECRAYLEKQGSKDDAKAAFAKRDADLDGLLSGGELMHGETKAR